MDPFSMDLLNKPKVKIQKCSPQKKTLVKVDVTNYIDDGGDKSYKDFIEFGFLMFVAILDSALSIFILGYSIWSYARKSYYYSQLFKICIDMSYFTIIGTLVGICCPWITIKISKLKLKYIFALIFMEFIEIVLLITGLSIGNVYLPNYTNTSMSISVTFPSDVLNQSFHTLFLNYHDDKQSKVALDRIQQGLWCCGEERGEDYVKNELTMPESCCLEGDCSTNAPFLEGCRTIVQRDIAWHSVTLKSLGSLMIAFYVATILMTVGVYISELLKLKNRNIENP